MTRALPLLLVLATTPGCLSDLVDKAREQGRQDAFDELDSDSESTSDTNGAPTPTTGTTTWGTSSETGSVADMPSNAADMPSNVAEVEILDFDASVYAINRAGTLVFTAEVDGPVSEMSLLVHRPGEPEPDTLPWPTNEPTLEYVVNSDALNGDVEFELVVASEDDDDRESLEVAVDLPRPGTLDGRWTIEGNSSTTGTALAILPGSGSEPDRVIAVGTQNDVPILVELVDDLLQVTKLGGPIDYVFPYAVAVEGDAMFLTGETLFGEMFLRRYDLVSKDKVWEKIYEDARAFDVGVGPDGQVVAVGEVDVDGQNAHTQAAVWMVDEWGGGTWTPITLERFTQSNKPLASGLRSSTWIDNHLIVVGYADMDLPEIRERASVFEVANNELVLVHALEATYATELSRWNCLSAANDTLHVSGWQRNDLGQPSSAAIGRFSKELSLEHLSLAWHGTGKTVSATGAAGTRVAGGSSRLFAQSGSWSEPYTETSGDQSSAEELRVDRHGLSYLVGHFRENGFDRFVLTRFAP